MATTTKYLKKAISDKENGERIINTPGRYDRVDTDLSRDWSASKGQSTRSWERASFASREAWDLLNTRR